MQPSVAQNTSDRPDVLFQLIRLYYCTHKAWKQFQYSKLNAQRDDTY